jgi:hypothetical protein
VTPRRPAAVRRRVAAVVPEVDVAPLPLAAVAVRDWLTGTLVAGGVAGVEVATRLAPTYHPHTQGPAVRVQLVSGVATDGLPDGDALVQLDVYAGTDADAALLALRVANALHGLSHARLSAYLVHLVAAHGLSTRPLLDTSVDPPADRYIVECYLTVGPLSAT